jgi:OmpA-OmpF porin, OOP family
MCFTAAMRSALVTLVIIFATGVVHATAEPFPSMDRPGSADSPVLQRFAGSLILQYEKKSLDEMTLPLSKLLPVPGKKAPGNNNAQAPKKTKQVEGEVTHILYIMPAGKSSLEVLKLYKDQIKDQNGKVLYECKGADCGGNAQGNSLDGGSTMGMAMYLRSGERVKEHPWSLPWCASQMRLSDVRYLAAEIPASGAHVSVMTASLPDVAGACQAILGRAIAMVDVIAVKPPAAKK